MDYLKYSVIIPVYNAEDTISRCLDSLLQGIPENTEIIVVNDGSADNSGLICREYLDKYPQIRYFEKRNEGVSSARNLGLDRAKGEYILFVDSDDFVEKNYWKIINTTLDEYHPDMLQFGFRECGETFNERNTGAYNIETDIDIAKKIDDAIQTYMFSALWARVYRRNIIEKYHLRFKEKLMVGEDQVFIFAYAMHIKHLISIPTVLYNVILENSISLTRKKRDYLVEQLREVNRILFHLVEKSEHSKNIKLIYQNAVTWVYYRSVYSCCKELLKYNISARRRREKIKMICQDYSSDHIKPIGFKCKIIAIPVICKMSLIIDILIQRF